MHGGGSWWNPVGTIPTRDARGDADRLLGCSPEILVGSCAPAAGGSPSLSLKGLRRADLPGQVVSGIRSKSIPDPARCPTSFVRPRTIDDYNDFHRQSPCSSNAAQK